MCVSGQHWPPVARGSEVALLVMLYRIYFTAIQLVVQSVHFTGESWRACIVAAIQKPFTNRCVLHDQDGKSDDSPSSRCDACHIQHPTRTRSYKARFLSYAMLLLLLLLRELRANSPTTTEKVVININISSIVLEYVGYTR